MTINELTGHIGSSFMEAGTESAKNANGRSLFEIQYPILIGMLGDKQVLANLTFPQVKQVAQKLEGPFKVNHPDKGPQKDKTGEDSAHNRVGALVTQIGFLVCMARANGDMGQAHFLSQDFDTRGLND